MADSNTQPLAKALNRRIETYLFLIQKLNFDNSKEVIHDVRVASRRLLALESVFFQAGKKTRWRKQIRSRARSLNQLRDLQVLEPSLLKDTRLSRLITEQISLEKKRLHTRLSCAADDKCYQALDKQKYKLAVVFNNSPQIAVAELHQAWNKSVTLVKTQLNTIDPLQPSTLHKLRIKIKKLRYLLEFLHDARLVKDISIEAFKHWQEMLGQLNDITFAVHWLHEYGPGYHQLKVLERQVHQLSRQFTADKKQFEQVINSTDLQVTSALQDIKL